MHKFNTKNQIVIKLGAMAAALLMMTSIVSAQNIFGAISFSPGTGARGWSNGYNSQYQAEQRALNECLGQRGTDCNTAIWFSNACGSLAVGNGNGWGAAWDKYRNLAEDKAIRSCRSHNNANCRIVETVCTSNAN